MNLLAQSMFNSTGIASYTPFEMIFGTVVVLCVCLYLLIGFVSTIFMVIDIINRDFGKQSSISFLSIILIFFYPIGHIVYYFIIRKRFPKRSSSASSKRSEST